MENSTIITYPISSSGQYDIPFDYLAKKFIVVTLTNTADPLDRKVLTYGLDYTIPAPRQVQFSPTLPVTGYDGVIINRYTDSELLVSFNDGSVLTSNGLTTSELQAIHIADEGRDVVSREVQPIVDGMNNLMRKALRVTDKDVAALGTAADRSGKVIAFDSNGDPALVLPSDGTATDVMLELAKPTGSGKIGTPWSATVEAVLGELMRKANGEIWVDADTSGTVDVTNVFYGADLEARASGKTVRVPAGRYLVKNLYLSGTWRGEPGAVLVGSLGERDNMLMLNPGADIEGFTFEKGLTAWAVDGDFGNAVRIGSYRQPVSGSKSYNIRVAKCKIISTTRAFNSQSIEVLGDVDNFELDGIIFEGPGAGIICHWGGDVGDAGAHDSMVTYSHHPRNGKIHNIIFRPDATFSMAPGNSIILSACYNVDLRNIMSYSVSRTLWIMPGDVYSEVSVSRDKGKICTGIFVDGLYINDPLADQEALSISGVPATKRTSQPTVYGRDRGATFGVTVRNANIACRDIVYTNPLLIIRGCSGVTAEILKSGGERSTGFWATIDYNTGCNIQLEGVSTQGVRSRGNADCELHFNGHRPLNTYSSDDGGCKIETFTSGSFSLGAASAGATSVTATISGADGVIFSGAKLMVGGEAIGVILKSALLKVGVATTLSVTPLSVSVTASTSASAALTHSGTTLRGVMDGFLYGWRIENGWGITLEVESTANARGGIIFSGAYLRDCSVIGSKFEYTGQENAVPSRFDIHVTASKVRGFKVLNNSFDVDAINPLVSNRLSVASSDHKGVIIANNVGSKTQGGVAFAIAQSSVNEPYSMQQIYGNSMGTDLTSPLATLTGMYIGPVFEGYARNNAVPTVGYFSAGDTIRKQTPTTGQEGWKCTVTGSPGTWVGFGSIS